ncbi:SRPBCC domain-containing protein [Nocardia sp. CNY236]|uniref:SRPBCC domain-containing protein n=1 Tax=Nocardia sp. CNY236 TaxID=1169152 RepID=UPI0004078046|nr:SRPBCC domain-containing protein [Nocardia sp. CNY236]
MSTPTLTHSTVEVARSYPASPDKIFAAYADVERRASWTAPDGHEVVYVTSSFDVDGVDDFQCGPVGRAELTGRVRYLDIKEGVRIVYSETISLGSEPLAISLVSWSLDPSDIGTEVTVISQICSFVGDDMIAGTREGLSMALGNLANAL